MRLSEAYELTNNILNQISFKAFDCNSDVIIGIIDETVNQNFKEIEKLKALEPIQEKKENDREIGYLREDVILMTRLYFLVENDVTDKTCNIIKDNLLKKIGKLSELENK